MLSYKHGFHAGNFADLHKHICLMIVLQAMQNKEKPYCFIDTHAGSGLYDLKGALAQKTKEYKKGISPLYQLFLESGKSNSSVFQSAPAVVDQYLNLIKSFNADNQGGLSHYPGSPLIARSLLREQDQMVAMELHTSEMNKLKAQFEQDAQVNIHHRDGLEGLIGLVPPPQKRGVVLIDPSYEVKSDYSAVREAIFKAHQRWSQGVFMIWYPLLSEQRHRGLLIELQKSGIKKIFHTQFLKAQDRPKKGQEDEKAHRGMHGSGVIVINPPWKFGERLHSIFSFLLKSVYQGDSFTGEWLVPE